MGFDEDDRQQPPDFVSLELDPNEDTGTTAKLAHMEKRLNALERQMAHVMALLELLAEDLTDSKPGPRNDTGDKDS